MCLTGLGGHGGSLAMVCLQLFFQSGGSCSGEAGLPRRRLLVQVGDSKLHSMGSLLGGSPCFVAGAGAYV